MPRLILVRTGGTDECPQFAPLDTEDLKVISGRTTLIVDVKGERAARTELQSRSIHLYLEHLATAFNEAGLTVHIVLTKLFKSPNFAWSQHLVKERVWRPVQEQTLGTESTTKIGTKEVSIIYESINRATAERLGVSVPFPDRYSQLSEQLSIKKENT